MKFTSELLRKLSQVGYMACMKGMDIKGEIIMEGIRGVRPDQVVVLIGLAIAKISARKYSDAENIIVNDVLPYEPNNMTAITFLGIIRFEMGNKNEAQLCFNKVYKYGDENHKKMAAVYTEEM